MAKFLIDVNLPYHFSLWNNSEYIHVKDINDEWKDREIWNYAKENELTIITKDSDFSNRILLREAPPKVIHIRFGNVNMKTFFELMTKHWNTVIELNYNHKLVNVYSDRIEGIE